MPADGIFSVGKEIFHERLVYDRDRRRREHVLRADSAAHDYVCSNRIKILGIGLDKRSVAAAIGLSLHLHSVAPVVFLHRRVVGNANSVHAGQLVKALLDGAIKGFQLAW